jgi:F-type H+-transporting ATPase subunit delta
MTLSAVATRYAKALADVVTAAGSALSPQNAVAELRSFEGVLASSSELRSAMMTPAISGSRKKAVLGKIADRLEVSRVSRNFIFVLVDHRRMALLGDILDSFELIVDERLGFARADITAASELGEGERKAVQARLEQISGKRIRAHYAVNESLIGGVVARIGSTVYDGSVRGELASLQRRLSAEA